MRILRRITHDPAGAQVADASIVHAVRLAVGAWTEDAMIVLREHELACGIVGRGVAREVLKARAGSCCSRSDAA